MFGFQVVGAGCAYQHALARLVASAFDKAWKGAAADVADVEPATLGVGVLERHKRSPAGVGVPSAAQR